MPVENNKDLYDAIKAVLIVVIMAALMGYFLSCTFGPVIGIGDIIEPEETDTCITPIEQTLPEFVTLYTEFDILQDSIRWQGGGVESYDLGDVIEALTDKPYTIYNQGKSWAVIIDSTNNHQAFKLKIFARSNGAKVYMAYHRQAFFFAGALNFSQYLECAEKYPSVDYFNFRNTAYDSIQYIQLAETILGDCKAGRYWADFRFNPYPMDTTIINQFINAGWENVLSN